MGQILVKQPMVLQRNTPRRSRLRIRMIYTLCAVAWGSLATDVCRAEAGRRERFHWSGWEIPARPLEERGLLAVIENEDAESVRTIVDDDDDDGAPIEQPVALQQRVSRRGIARGALPVARTPAISRDEAVPGVYRVTARLKIDGDLGVIGTPIELTVVEDAPGGRRVGRSWTTCDFTENDAYVELSFLYEFDRDARRLPAREARTPSRFAGYYHEVYPEATTPSPSADEPPPGIAVTLELPRTRYSSRTGMPPNSLRALSLDWIALERIQPSPSLTVRHVRPQLLWMRPGTEQQFSVAIQNFTETSHTRTVAVVLESGLDRREQIHTGEVTLDPGAVHTIDITWPTDAATPLFGYRVVAEVRDGATVDHAADDVFQIHPRCYDVHVSGARSRGVNPFREPESYRNYIEQFGMTPGDCSRLMPRNEYWMGGMMAVPYSMRLTQAAVEHNRGQGIASFFYLFAGGTGTALMDMYVERPEFMAARITATDVMYQKISEHQAAVRDHTWGQSPPEALSGVPHVEQHLNHIHPELKEQIEREAVEFVNATGFQGVRFDVGIFAPKSGVSILGEDLGFDMRDAHAHAARNFNDFRNRLGEVDPNIEFGANMDSWGYLEHVGLRDRTPPPVETYEEFLAFANAHGMFMDEGTMNAPLFDHYLNRWDDVFWSLAQKRHTAARHGGVYETFSPHRDGTGHFCHDDIYWTIANFATGSHYVGNFAPVPYSEHGGVGPFITRFSEFFWDIKLRQLENAAELVFVDAPAEVWYVDTAMHRTLPDGRQRWVLPLVNPPLADRLRRNPNNELPPPLEAFEIELDAPEGYAAADAWMITWEPRTEAVRLPSEWTGRRLIVQFPGLQLFRTLVVEWR